MQKIKYYIVVICCLFAWEMVNAQNDSLLPEDEINVLYVRLYVKESDNADSLLIGDKRPTSGRTNMGYYSMPNAAITGAVETVSGATLAKTPSANLSHSFAGRFIGLTTMESSSELSNASISKFIRGISTVNGTLPLVIIDGIACPSYNWDYITPQEIESISVLKDGASTAIYGMQGAGGAIIITTKRGFEGKAKIDVFVDNAFQQNVRHPEFINSAQYAQMRNQAFINDGMNPPFSQSDIEGFQQGNNPLYPNNDWYSMSVRDWTTMQRAGLSVAGGNEGVRYYTNLGYMHQTSPMKISDDPNRKYDPAPQANSINFRSNVDILLNKYLTGYVGLSGNINLQRTTYYPATVAYSAIFDLPPTLFGPLTGDYALPDTDVTNQVTSIDDSNTTPVYGMLNRSGYRNILQTTIAAQAGVTMDMSFLLKGLSASALLAYQTYTYSNTATTQNFERYAVTSRFGEEPTFRKLGDGTQSYDNTPLIYGKFTQFSYNLNLFAHADYNRTFGEHSISAMAYWLSLTDDKIIPYASIAVQGYTTIGSEILPYRRNDMGAYLLYGFRNRYFLKGDLGYTGSDQFARGHRYVATPAVSAAWIASEEAFLKDNAFLTYLKLRASYGINANDQLGDNRFLYLDKYDAYGNEAQKGNPEVTAEKIRKMNFGVDFSLFRDLSFGFDYYRAYTNTMLIDGSIPLPTYSGILVYPKLNAGEMENRGFEASVMYQKQLNKDLLLFAGTGVAYNKNKVISVMEVPWDETYKYRYRTEGYSVLQNWGYLVDYSNGNGYINTPEELAAAPIYEISGMGSPRLGDLLYQDISGDGRIDNKDLAPVGNTLIPEIYYNVNLGFNYKRFEFSALLQGTARSNDMLISGVGIDESWEQGYFSDMHLNAWTPERYAANEKIEFPALSTNISTSHAANDFFLASTAYLRLRNLEVAYTLPESLSKQVSAGKIRVYLNAQNLFTIDYMPSKYIDPETNSIDNMPTNYTNVIRTYSTGFHPYRVFNVGVSATF
ncbi:MAG: SusC/RagA family TonB-linked outer membrane protein [Dysgonamonadaceae bacterium]|jgi:TonB-linked SusC/RagA family outer membrane protein|nr:SusC/RagA family TonB-linked outer membrane protein [Dysgonamonadaceae bacterium]